MWKNLENRSTFAEVKGKNTLSCFFYSRVAAVVEAVVADGGSIAFCFVLVGMLMYRVKRRRATVHQ